MKEKDVELREHKFIVFCVDHYNPLDVIRSIGEIGLEPIVILVSENPMLINNCKYVKILHIVSTREQGYEILLSKYGKEQVKPFLYCSDDKTINFIDGHLTDIMDRFICFNAVDPGRMTWLQNKNNIAKLGVEAGLVIPKSEVVDTGTLPKTLKYPIITKVLVSTMGAWKNDVFVCQNEDELKDAFNKIKSPKLILQEFIRKEGEIAIEGFSINNGHDIFVPYMFDYIRYYDNSYGHYMTVSFFDNEDLKKKIIKLLSLTKFNGIFEIEFMKGPDGVLYFLEINLRTSPWAYALTKAGGNLPYLWAKSTLAGNIVFDEMKLRKEKFNAIADFDDFYGNVRTGKVGLFRWIKEWKNSECHYYYNKEDMKPFWTKLKNDRRRIIACIIKSLLHKYEKNYK